MFFFGKKKIFCCSLLENSENSSFWYGFGSILVRSIELRGSTEPSNYIELPGSIELEPVRVRFVRSLINRLKNCFKYIHSMFELAELTQNTLQIHLKSIQFQATFKKNLNSLSTSCLGRSILVCYMQSFSHLMIIQVH